MSKKLHEEVSSILALVLEKDKEEALKIIHKKCKDDKLLLKEVLDLYKEFTIVTPNNEITSPQNDSAYINIKTSFSTLTNRVRSKIFQNRNLRLLSIVIVLSLLFSVGFVARNSIKKSIFDAEIEEKKSINENTILRLKSWISDEKRKIKEMANSPIFIDLANKVDSLNKLDLNLQEYNTAILPISTKIKKLNDIMGFEVIIILHKSELKITYDTYQSTDTENSPLINQQIGKAFFDYYMQLKEGKTIFVPPIHHSKNLQNSVLDQVDSDCVVATPIYKNQKIIGYLANATYAKNQFSAIFKASQYGNSSETYAINSNLLMISESRFSNTLYDNGFLKNPSSIYSIVCQDPGFDLMNPSNEKYKIVNVPLTETSLKINNYLENNTIANEGAIPFVYNDYRGIPVIGVWKWDKELGFGIISKQDASEAFAILKVIDIILICLYLIIGGLAFMVYHSNFTLAKFSKKMNRFGQFKVIEKIGEGGFGEVYKGEHALLKMPVAIKLLKENVSTEENNIRFEKEVRATSKLKHANTIKIYDFGTTNNGNFYYIMEYIEGVTLSNIIDRDEEIPIGRIIHFLLEISYSLREAHHNHLIHRDIKPANIIITKQGEDFDSIKLLDFGLVKDLNAKEKDVTSFHQIGGTPLYMSPERIHNPLMSNDAKVDIYSLGIIGFSMLSGNLLVDLISQKALSGKEAFDTKMLENMIERNDVTEKLLEVLSESIAFNPSERTSSIDQFIDHLLHLQKKFPWTEKMAKNWWDKYDIYS